MELSARIVSLELAETFTIARGSQDTADLVEVEIGYEGVSGYGEAAPIERYGESAESALAYAEAVSGELGDDPFTLEEALEKLTRAYKTYPPGPSDTTPAGGVATAWPLAPAAAAVATACSRRGRCPPPPGRQ